MANGVYRGLFAWPRPCRDWEVTCFFLHPWVRKALPAQRVAVLETLIDIECQLREVRRELLRIRDRFPDREPLEPDDIAVLKSLGFQPVEARA